MIKSVFGKDPTKVTSKTSRAGGGGLHDRWVDKKGRIYEHDKKTNTIEMYTKRGIHLGEFRLDGTPLG